MKNFVIAILLAVLITYSFGQIATEWFDMSIIMHDEFLSPFESVAGVTIVGVIMAIVGFIVAISVFGVLIFTVFAVAVGILVAGLSVFWPMILLLMLVVWLVRDKDPA